MISGIHHVAVNRRDIEPMIRFYRVAFVSEQVDSFGWDDGPEIQQCAAEVTFTLEKLG